MSDLALYKSEILTLAFLTLAAFAYISTVTLALWCAVKGEK